MRGVSLLLLSLLQQKDQNTALGWLCTMWQEDRASLRSEGGCCLCGKRTWQHRQCPHRDAISNVSKCFLLRSVDYSSMLSIWFDSLSSTFFLQLLQQPVRLDWGQKIHIPVRKKQHMHIYYYKDKTENKTHTSYFFIPDIVGRGNRRIWTRAKGNKIFVSIQELKI